MRGIKITFRVRQFVRISIGGIYTAVGKKWTNLDDLSPVLLATFNRFDVYETLCEKCFPRIDVFFRTHDFSHPREQDVHNGTRRCFAKSFCLWIIIKLLRIDLDSKARDLYIRRSPLLSLYG